jgi:hypothetical protein
MARREISSNIVTVAEIIEAHDEWRQSIGDLSGNNQSEFVTKIIMRLRADQDGKVSAAFNRLRFVDKRFLIAIIISAAIIGQNAQLMADYARLEWQLILDLKRQTASLNELLGMLTSEMEGIAKDTLFIEEQQFSQSVEIVARELPGIIEFLDSITADTNHHQICNDYFMSQNAMEVQRCKSE